MVFFRIIWIASFTLMFAGVGVEAKSGQLGAPSECDLDLVDAATAQIPDQILSDLAQLLVHYESVPEQDNSNEMLKRILFEKLNSLRGVLIQLPMMREAHASGLSDLDFERLLEAVARELLSPYLQLFKEESGQLVTQVENQETRARGDEAVLMVELAEQEVERRVAEVKRIEDRIAEIKREMDIVQHEHMRTKNFPKDKKLYTDHLKQFKNSEILNSPIIKDPLLNKVIIEKSELNISKSLVGASQMLRGLFSSKGNLASKLDPSPAIPSSVENIPSSNKSILEILKEYDNNAILSSNHQLMQRMSTIMLTTNSPGGIFPELRQLRKDLIVAKQKLKIAQDALEERRRALSANPGENH